MDNGRPSDLATLRLDEQSPRWEEMLDATLQRLDPVLEQRRAGLLGTIAGWSRPLIIAAAVLLALLGPTEWILELREPHVEEVGALVRLSEQTAFGDPPTGSELFVTLGRGMLP